MESVPLKAIAPLSPKLPPLPTAEAMVSVVSESAPKPDPQSSKAAIRTSLKASTLDGVFATVFSNIAGGVLLSNFLVELHATPTEIGLLSSIPMLANLLQPLGAYLSDRTTSRHWYGLLIYGPSRLLWLFLCLGIELTHWGHFNPHQLVHWTLGILLVSHFLGALGSASWLSWLAVLVPRRLRGRYFGIRNSAASLTSLLCIPLTGLMVSRWSGGTLEGYGVVLFLGLIAGLISLGFQYFMMDVNPQVQQIIPFNGNQKNSSDEIPPRSVELTIDPAPAAETGLEQTDLSPHMLQDSNFLRFLLYFAVWMFAVNLSAPFFNLYLLDNLSLDISWVTLYTSLSSGANLLMLVLWGRLADRFGNRSILILVGILVAITPLLWLGTGANSMSIWFWLPLLHLLGGGTWAAIDLCSSNMQMGVAPIRHQSSYFAIAAAVAGVSGALGTTAGGVLAECANYGGLPGLFALSSVLRLAALLPLVFVREQGGRSLRQTLRVFLPAKLSSETPEA